MTSDSFQGVVGLRCQKFTLYRIWLQCLFILVYRYFIIEFDICQTCWSIKNYCQLLVAYLHLVILFRILC